MKCEFFSLSDTGRCRTNNEDTVVTVPARGLALVADGMGGYNAGEVASTMAAHLVADQLTQDPLLGRAQPGHIQSCLRDSVQLANRAIYEAARRDPQQQGMGTTLVVALFHGARLTVGHVGDSRLYRVRQCQITALTKDHSWLQEHIDAGRIVAQHAALAPHKHLLTRAVGTHPSVTLDLAEHVVQAGDLYLLSSDGLHDTLSEPHMLQILLHTPSLPLAAQRLVDAANAAGGQDNISLVLVQCAPGTTHPQPR